jgi:DNA-directed RNA polymerase subunit RPC12/RpoP
MAGRKGKECPHCGKKTFHNTGSLHECSRCGVMGWTWQHGIDRMGQGVGMKCPNCEWKTLHSAGEIAKGRLVRRCGTCNYTLIAPPTP